jgi:hypothetical protein
MQLKYKETAVSVLKGEKMTTIPKELQKIHEDVSKLLTEYCEKYLDKEYEELCLHALDKLCCRRPSPMKRGRANTWTAGIIYAIGCNNFIFDKSQPIHMSVQELITPLGVARSTAANKALIIKKMLKIDYYALEWTLPTSIANNTMIWMVSMNGLTYDARKLPVKLQEKFYKEGKIPYVPAHKKLESQT